MLDSERVKPVLFSALSPPSVRFGLRMPRRESVDSEVEVLPSMYGPSRRRKNSLFGNGPEPTPYDHTPKRSGGGMLSIAKSALSAVPLLGSLFRRDESEEEIHEFETDEEHQYLQGRTIYFPKRIPRPYTGIPIQSSPTSNEIRLATVEKPSPPLNPIQLELHPPPPPPPPPSALKKDDEEVIIENPVEQDVVDVLDDFKEEENKVLRTLPRLNPKPLPRKNLISVLKSIESDYKDSLSYTDFKFYQRKRRGILGNELKRLIKMQEMAAASRCIEYIEASEKEVSAEDLADHETFQQKAGPAIDLEVPSDEDDERPPKPEDTTPRPTITADRYRADEVVSQERPRKIVRIDTPPVERVVEPPPVIELSSALFSQEKPAEPSTDVPRKDQMMEPHIVETDESKVSSAQQSPAFGESMQQDKSPLFNSAQEERAAEDQNNFQDVRTTPLENAFQDRGASLFGTVTSQTEKASPFGQERPTETSVLFGSAPSQSLFGNSTSQDKPLFSDTMTSQEKSLFPINNNNQPATSTTQPATSTTQDKPLFGGTSGTSLYGNTTEVPSLFSQEKPTGAPSVLFGSDSVLFGTASQDKPPFGTSTESKPLFGTSTQEKGLFDTAPQDKGLFGSSTQDKGLFGSATQDKGLFGSSQDKGLFGSVTQDKGLFGTTTQEKNLFGTAQQSQGLFGTQEKGLFGTQEKGLFGTTSQDKGLFGTATQDKGLFGTASSGDKPLSLIETPQVSPSLFGSQQNQHKTLFGTEAPLFNNVSFGTPQEPNKSLFGDLSKPAFGSMGDSKPSGLFGSDAGSPVNSTPLFGSSNPQNATSPNRVQFSSAMSQAPLGTGLFGEAPSFGSAQPSPFAASPFGSSPAPGGENQNSFMPPMPKYKRKNR